MGVLKPLFVSAKAGALKNAELPTPWQPLNLKHFKGFSIKVAKLPKLPGCQWLEPLFTSAKAGAFICFSEGWSLYLFQRRLEPLFTSIEKTEVR
jgi:hypothetical protein